MNYNNKTRDELIKELLKFRDKHDLLKTLNEEDITRHKQDEAALKNLLSLTEATLESIHNGILVISLQRTVIKTNAKFAEMWRIPGDILNSGDDKQLLDFVLGQLSDPEAFIEKVEELYEKPEAESFDLLYFKDGRIFERISKPMYLGAEPGGRVWSFLDITERKLVEEALHQEKENFRHSLDDSPLGVRVATTEGKAIYANRTLLNFYGYGSLEELQNTHLKDRYTPESYIGAQNRKRQRVGGDLSATDYEISIIRKNGELRHLQVFRKEIMWDGKRQFQTIYNDITERKLADEKIKFLASRNEAILAAVPDIIMEVDKNKIYTWANKSGFEFFGDDVIGKEASSFFIAKQNTYQVVEPIFDGREEKVYVESWQRRKDGEKRLLAWWCHVLKDVNGKVTGVLSTSLDITEIKQAENIINHERVMLRTLIDNLPTPVTFKDSQGHYILNNTAHLKLIGASKQEEATGKTTFDFFPETEAREYDKDDKRIISTGEKMLGKEEVARHMDTGETYWHLTSKIPLTGADSKVTHLITISHDITQQKLIQEELKKNQAQLMNAHKIAHLGSWEYDVGNDIFTFNDLFYAIFRTTAEQVGGYTMKSADYANRFVHPDDMALVGLETRKAIETDDPNFSRQLEHRIIYADGETGYITVRFFIVKDEHRKTIKTYGVNQDITERKRGETALIKAAEQMKLAKEKAEASDNLKTTFLNNISHEIRTPLNGILGFAEIMSQPDLPEDEKKLSLSMLFESSDRLLNTITNYMDISLITSGTMSLHKKYFLPAQILREILTKNKKICSLKNIDLTLQIPEKDEEIPIHTDPEILKKIVTHLLNNAIKFTEKGKILYGYLVNRKDLEFFVKDTGRGIGKDSLENIFEHFVKEDYGPLEISEGSGLGLSISKGLVELLGGKMRVESEKGKGSVFSFTVPVETEFKNRHISLNEVGQNKNQTKNSILVAEDDEINFFYLRALLRQNTAAEIIHASDGRDAVEKFQKNSQIGLILMDIKMPVMDGLEAARHIRSINRNVPIIAITAYAMTGDEARIIEAGCDGYLSKPIDKKLLLEKLSVYIKM